MPGTKNVTIMVTNDGRTRCAGADRNTASIDEGDTDVPGTYTLTEIEDGPTVKWSKEDVDWRQRTSRSKARA